MIVINSLKAIPPLKKPIALTIGTFDGVHLGHQHLFQQLKKHGTVAVLTFSNHPAEVLHATHIPPLCSLEQKLSLFKDHGIDLAIVLRFTPELALTPYDTFLKQIHHYLPFATLILGQGAVIGHQAQGDEARIKTLSKEMDFEAIYLPKATYDNETVSSRKIRELIKTGKTEQAHHLLGRG
jgi:riboflavin kinase/FMN adenylyltransferase